MVITRRATIPESEAFRKRHEVPRVKKETRDETDHHMTCWMWTISYRAVISSWQPAAGDYCQLLWRKSLATSLMKDTESLDTEQVWPADSYPWYKLKSKLASYFEIACFSSKKSNDKVGFSIKISLHCIPSSYQDFSVLLHNTSISERDKGAWHTCVIRTIIFVMSNNKAIIDVPQLRLPANTEWSDEPLLLEMNNRRERKTSGESTASDSSETASCRPYCLPETPADFSSSQVVRSATPSTWYAPCSSSTSRVGGYSQSPSDLMDFHRDNQQVTITPN